MRYQTLEELALAYQSGDLDLKTPLLLDNDDTFVYTDETGEGDDWVDGERVFQGGVPMELLIEALDLLGIPSEGV